MKSSLVVLSLVTFVSSNSFATSVKFDIQLHEILTLKKVSNARFEKISDVATGIASLEMEANGVKKTLLRQALNESAPANNVAIEITGKNTVRIIDQKENINQEVQADIDKSLFGGLKTITIKSEILQTLYSEGLKKSGLDILRGLNVGNQFSSDVTFSDEVCSRDGDLLVCTQDSRLEINVAD